MLATVLVRGFGDFAGEFFLSRVSYRVVHQLRIQLFDQLLRMPSAYFDRSAKGHLVSRITFNVAQLRDTATDALKTVVQDGSKVVVLLGAMIWANWRLTMIFLVIAPVVAIVVSYASNRFRNISRRIQNSMGDVTHVASEAVNGYRVVRTFGGEDVRTQTVRKVEPRESATESEDGGDEGVEHRDHPGLRRRRAVGADRAAVPTAHCGRDVAGRRRLFRRFGGICSRAPSRSYRR